MHFLWQVSILYYFPSDFLQSFEAPEPIQFLNCWRVTCFDWHEQLFVQLVSIFSPCLIDFEQRRRNGQHHSVFIFVLAETRLGGVLIK